MHASVNSPQFVAAATRGTISAQEHAQRMIQGTQALQAAKAAAPKKG